ncbi:MAG: hypothetical protein HUJ69_08780 [Lachnospiraceae bacterium]|nr:hypothetical protein [Lachnospiraceae bacterium]
MWVHRQKGNSRYYLVTKADGAKKEEYVTIDRVEEAKGMIQKHYLKKVYSRILDEIDGLTRVISAMQKIERRLPEETCNHLSEWRQEVITPCILSDNEYRARWEKEEYSPLDYGVKPSGFVTDKNEHVRSKSELLIASKLNQMNLSYKYEKPLFLKGLGIIYPDFTVLNTRTRQEVYIEHFGMMDDKEYLENALKKIAFYETNGYLPGKSLIFFMETGTSQINIKALENVIKSTCF